MILLIARIWMQKSQEVEAKEPLFFALGSLICHSPNRVSFWKDSELPFAIYQKKKANLLLWNVYKVLLLPSSCLLQPRQREFGLL